MTSSDAETITVKYFIMISDQIAIPDFQAVAMENWGLVMYYEPTLLYNPAVPTTELKEQVVSIISHELAHMVSNVRSFRTHSLDRSCVIRGNVSSVNSKCVC